MGCSGGRCFLLAICSLQMVAVLERLVFDFIGYMWASIIGNFLQLIFVIVGLFGTFQYRPRVVLSYAIWNLFWIGLNTVVILLYLQKVVPIGALAQLDAVSVLSINVRQESWWIQSGWSCDTQSGCFLEYYYIEIIQAGIQCLLALIAFVTACCVIYIFTEEDDSSQPVSDELEYIKMRYKSPARDTVPRNDHRAYDTLQTSNYNTLNTTVESTLDHYDRERLRRERDHHREQERELDRERERQRLREIRDRDKYADKPQIRKDERTAIPERREQLPWVHVAPSVTSDYPQTLDMDEVGPPGYYQISIASSQDQRAYRRDKDSVII
ncbi:sodium/potassium-transporting ATPase subunit beta-1-interacting protein 1-like isoform X2 [Lineus longissimus]|uniref:sodium/potassium-transporting ATPase subunit beta-1-interacting protein 1-like isoform X2 n=1 Tax=Lineus longissimus TaxID=88925 RepID=UPI002B4D5950